MGVPQLWQKFFVSKTNHLLFPISGLAKNRAVRLFLFPIQLTGDFN